MENNHSLSSEAIDALFQNQGADGGNSSTAALAQRYDFRRSDRIPKEQIRSLRTIHDTFARSLSSSLWAYLRTYVSVNLISVEQLSFRDFVGCLPSPTCLAVMRIRPFDAVAILELNPGLAFPMIEMLLGGGKMKPLVVHRELTTIEQNILDSLLGLILQNLSMAWQGVATLDFTIESHDTEPGLLHVLPPNEGVVSIATEIQLGDTSGMMNIGIPASVVKKLRQKFDLQWSSRRSSGVEAEVARSLAFVEDAVLNLDARVEGSVVRFNDLLHLTEGDILLFDQRTSEPVSVQLNGCSKYTGKVMLSEGRKAVTIMDKM